ncbi:MAG: LysR substrate-binding domain-containing protein [Kofleriaceae bacterium]
MDMLDQMATYVRVVDGKSLSAAARGLRLSLPAVSRQLRALESELGASLIVRSTRKLHVTDAGQRWYVHCVRVLREIEEAKRSVQSSRSVRGTLVVSASLSFGLLAVVPRLTALVERHPDLVVDLRLEDRVVDLVGDGIDVALRAGAAPPDSTAYVASPIATMIRVLVAAPGWLRKHPVRTPLQLARHPCLVQITPTGALIRWQLVRAGEAVTVEVRGPLRSSAPIALRDMAIAGAGIAYVPDWLVEADLARGTLVRVLPEWASPPIAASAVYRAHMRGDARLTAFLSVLGRRTLRA